MLHTDDGKWVLYPRRDFVRNRSLITLAAVSLPAAIVGMIGALVADRDTLTAAAWLLAFTWICCSPAIAIIAGTRLKLRRGRVSLNGPLGITWWVCKASDLDVVVGLTGIRDRKKVHLALNRATDQLLGAFAFDTFDAAELDRLLVASGCHRSGRVYKYRARMLVLT